MKLISVLLGLIIISGLFIQQPVKGATYYCCEQDDPGTCAPGMGPTRYYCYSSMAECTAGTCAAPF